MKVNDPRLDRVLNWVGVFTLILVVVTLSLFVIAVPRISDTASATSEIQQGNELASCRSQYRVHVDDAIGRVIAADSNLDELTSRGLEAAANGGDPQPAFANASAARQEVNDAVAVLIEATDTYHRAVELSAENPEAFLAECEKL
jgi:uncharacterized iron-regulated membrane protein